MCSILIVGCASKNKTPIQLSYASSSKMLNIEIASSALYFTKLKTETRADTMDVFVYTKLMHLTFSPQNKQVKRQITLPDSIRFIRYGINVYQLEELQTTRSKSSNPTKKMP